MSRGAGEGAAAFEPVSAWILGLAVALGACLGVVAKLLGNFEGPLLILGLGVSFWVSAGYLVAWRAGKGRGLVDGTVWAGTTMAVYLGVWLLAYCVVFGFQTPSGFGAAWLDERIFFIIAPAVSAVLGFCAVASWREGVLGSMSLAAMPAFALPEVGFSITQGWQFALIVGLPTLALAAVPAVMRHHRRVNWWVFGATCVVGAGVAVGLMVAVTGRI